MENKESKEEIKYSTPKARKYFVLFKFLEFFGVFLFFFGFYSLGQFRLNQGWWWGDLLHLSNPLTERYFEIWTFGLLTFIELFISVILVVLVVMLIFGILWGWVELNWYWSKLAGENEQDKIKRLKIKVKNKLIREKAEKKKKAKEEKEKEKAFRLRYGYYVGDKVIVTEDDCEYNGQKGIVESIGGLGGLPHLKGISYGFYKDGLKKTR